MVEKRHLFISAAVAMLISILLSPPLLLFILGLAIGAITWREFSRANDDARIFLAILPIAVALTGLASYAGAVIAAGLSTSILMFYLAERQ